MSILSSLKKLQQVAFPTFPTTNFNERRMVLRGMVVGALVPTAMLTACGGGGGGAPNNLSEGTETLPSSQNFQRIHVENPNYIENPPNRQVVLGSYPSPDFETNLNQGIPKIPNPKEIILQAISNKKNQNNKGYSSRELFIREIIQSLITNKIGDFSSILQSVTIPPNIAPADIFLSAARYDLQSLLQLGFSAAQIQTILELTFMVGINIHYFFTSHFSSIQNINLSEDAKNTLLQMLSDTYIEMVQQSRTDYTFTSASQFKSWYSLAVQSVRSTATLPADPETIFHTEGLEYAGIGAAPSKSDMEKNPQVLIVMPKNLIAEFKNQLQTNVNSPYRMYQGTQIHFWIKGVEENELQSDMNDTDPYIMAGTLSGNDTAQSITAQYPWINGSLTLANNKNQHIGVTSYGGKPRMFVSQFMIDPQTPDWNSILLTMGHENGHALYSQWDEYPTNRETVEGLENNCLKNTTNTTELTTISTDWTTLFKEVFGKIVPKWENPVNALTPSSCGVNGATGHEGESAMNYLYPPNYLENANEHNRFSPHSYWLITKRWDTLFQNWSFRQSAVQARGAVPQPINHRLTHPTQCKQKKTFRKS